MWNRAFGRKEKAMIPRPLCAVLQPSLAALALVALPVAPAMPAAAKGCSTADTGITLPKGFCATIFADKVGHARQMTGRPLWPLFRLN